MAAPLQDRSFEPAGFGTRVLFGTVVAVLVGLVAEGAIIYKVAHLSGTARVPVALSAVGIPALLAITWFAARIQRYRLTADSLVIERGLLSRRFPLRGLSSAEVASDVMKGAWKIFGNDGLGAIAGSFRSRRWGGFKAYLTDTRTAVVLLLADGRRVIISPAHPQSFVEEAKRRSA